MFHKKPQQDSHVFSQTSVSRRGCLSCLLNLTVLLKIRKHTETTPLTCTRTYFLFDVTARLSQHTTENPDVIFRSDVVNRLFIYNTYFTCVQFFLRWSHIILQEQSTSRKSIISNKAKHFHVHGSSWSQVLHLKICLWSKVKKKGGGASLRSEAIMVLKISPLVPFEF